ncbi:MAG: serine hydrolase [Sarcina sp.]
MAETYNQINKDTLSENEYITITPDMKVAGSGFIANKSGTQNYTVAQLIEYMIINSDNTAANVLIDRVGMDNINGNIENHGLSNTSLNRKMMDFASINSRIINTVSSVDLVKTFDLIAKSEYVNKYYDQKMIDIMKRQTNRTKIPANLPTLVEVANKAGELDQVENDTGLVFTKNRTYSISILLEGPMGNKRAYIAVIYIIYDNYINYSF